MESTVSQNECGSWREGRNQAVSQTQLMTQRDGGWFLNQQRVGASIDGEPIDVVGADDTAQSSGPLEEREWDAPTVQLVRCREAADPSAYDRDLDVAVRHHTVRA